MTLRAVSLAAGSEYLQTGKCYYWSSYNNLWSDWLTLTSTLSYDDLDSDEALSVPNLMESLVSSCQGTPPAIMISKIFISDWSVV